MEEYEKIELKSEDVQEILGTPPAWIVRWGTVITALSVVGLVLLGWKWKYPDLVKAELYLTTTNPPIRVSTKTDGDQLRLFVKENEKVEKGEKLAVIENQASFDDILTLSQHLDSLIVLPSYLLNIYVLPRRLEIGELTDEFNNLKKLLGDYQFVNRQSVDQEATNKLQEQIAALREAIADDEKRVEVATEEMKHKKNYHESLKRDYSDKKIGREELVKSRAEIVSVENKIKGFRADQKSKDRSIKNLEFEIQKIRKSAQRGNSDKLRETQQSIDVLRQKMEMWKKNYIIEAPVQGTVILSDYSSTNKFLKKGDSIMAIDPEREEEIVAFAKLKQEGSGRVVVGQKVNIKLLSYPSHDHGFLKGLVKDKTLQHSEGHYLLEIELSNGMTTTRGEEISFVQRMAGVAEIITEEKNVLERIFSSLISIFGND